MKKLCGIKLLTEGESGTKKEREKERKRERERECVCERGRDR